MNIALVGVGGYGGAYISFFQRILPEEFRLVAAVEPYPEAAEGTAWLHSQNIPIYNDLETLYAHTCPELVILSTPIPLHKSQAIYCMEHGSHVLCEKPLTPSYEDAMEIRATSLRTGRTLAVGFQWSFSDTMIALKKDLLDGVLGRPLFFRTHISWVRPESYYTSSTWKGRIRDAKGNLVCDSILTNATAHYLHNVFFINGDSLHTAALPVALRGMLGRTYSIETYDTCFVEGELPGGCRFLHVATHSAERNSEPQLIYEFEKATVYFDSNTDPTLYAIFQDGSRKDYGKPLSEREVSQKVSRLAEQIRLGEPPSCGVDTILPHLQCCNALLNQLPITEFPASDRGERSDGHNRFLFTRGLYEETVRCYKKGLLPSGWQEVQI